MAETLENKAAAILADPSFDVAAFVEQINLHFENPQIVKSLAHDAGVFLSILSMGRYEFIRKNPDFIDPKIFDEYHQMGFEVWNKEKDNGSYRGKSKWYGVFFEELSLGILWKRLSHSYNPKYEMVFFANTTSKKMSSVCKRYKMAPIGEDYVTQARNAPAVQVVRQKVLDVLSKMGFSDWYSMAASSNRTEIDAWHGDRRSWYTNGSERYEFNIRSHNTKKSRLMITVEDVDLKVPESEVKKITDTIRQGKWYNAELRIDNASEDIPKQVFEWLGKTSKKFEPLLDRYNQYKLAQAVAVNV
jgi:hypothetical protein